MEICEDMIVGYEVSQETMSWYDANRYCQRNYGTTLVSIYDNTWNDIAWNLCRVGVFIVFLFLFLELRFCEDSHFFFF